MIRNNQPSRFRQLAYDLTEGTGPGVVFLGGFRSDKEGNKALHLEEWAQRRGRNFLHFDYSGHGQSQGNFEDGCVGDWAEDAAAIIANLTDGPQLLVGSSMGGWIALLLAREMPDRVGGLVTIAAAPDFTEDGIWASLDAGKKQKLDRDGCIELDSEYSSEPTIITQRLIEDGRKHLVLRSPLSVSCPARFLQGTGDVDVPVSVALRLLNHVNGDDIRLTLVKNADHRFSDPECLALIVHAIEEVSARMT
mgnify:FL=1